MSRWQGQDPWREQEIASRVSTLEEVRNPTSPTDAFVSFRLQFLTVPDRDLAAFTREFYSQLSEQLGESSLWLVEFQPALRWRIAAVRMLFGAKEHPELLAQTHAGGPRLPTPMALLPSLGFGFDAFVEPALLPTSPWILGMNGIRADGQVIVMFGDSQPGFTGKQANDPLDILRGRSPVTRSWSRPNFPAAAAQAWIAWWIGAINHLLGKALDLANFTNPNGSYDPGLHLGVLATIERLFAIVQTILADAHRPHDRVRRMFDVIDLLDGLSFGSWESLLRPDRVRRQLEILQETLPANVHAIALPRCVAAVEQLSEFSEGFQPRTSDGKLRARSPSGEPIDITVDAATHTYLRLIRNSGTHSFRKALRDPYQRSIVAARTDAIPDELADLAFLHLLRFLSQPRLPAS
jgi:hypothetical protein